MSYGTKLVGGGLGVLALSAVVGALILAVAGPLAAAVGLPPLSLPGGLPLGRLALLVLVLGISISWLLDFYRDRKRPPKRR